MLDSMRALSKSFASKLLMGLLIVAFGIWGVGDMVRQHGSSYAAKVDGAAITIPQFQHAARLLQSQLQSMGISGIPEQKLAEMAIRQMVQQRLTTLSLHDLGLYVGDELAARSIAEMKAFQDKNGKFDAALYAARMGKDKTAEAGLVEQSKQDVAAAFLADSLEMKDVTPPEALTRLEARIAGETRDAALITLPARSDGTAPKEEDLKAYYEANKVQRYQVPEQRSIEYVLLTPSDVEDLVDRRLTPSMIEEGAKAHPDLNEKLLRMKLRDLHRDEILLNLSNNVEDALAAGKTREEAFRAAGLIVAPKKLEIVTAEMERSSPDEAAKVAVKQAFTLSEGEISNLLTLKSGARLILSVSKVTPPSAKPYETVAADVKQQVLKEQAADAASKKALEVKEALAKSPNWQAVTSSMNLAHRMVSRVARPTGAKEAARSDVPPALQEALFEHAMGEVAGPLVLPNGDQLIAVVTATHLPEAASVKLDDKTSQKAAEALTSEVQNAAYQAFAKRHRVSINPEIMRAPAKEE